MKKSLLTAALSVGLALSSQNAFANQAPLSDAAKDCIIAKQQQRLQANRIGAANAGTALGFLPDWFFIATSANLELNASIADVQREMPKILKVLETSDDISDAMRSQVIAQFKAMQDKFADQQMKILAITRMMGNKSGPNASLYETIASVLAGIQNADMKAIFDNCGAQNTKEIEQWLASVLASPNDDEDANVTAKACDPEDWERALGIRDYHADINARASALRSAMVNVALKTPLSLISSPQEMLDYFDKNKKVSTNAAPQANFNSFDDVVAYLQRQGDSSKNSADLDDVESEFRSALSNYNEVLASINAGNSPNNSFSDVYLTQIKLSIKEIIDASSAAVAKSIRALVEAQKGNCDLANSLLDEI